MEIDAMQDFEAKRRQRFISEQYYDWLSPEIAEDIEYWRHNDSPNGDNEAERKSLAAMVVAKQSLNLLLLKYTAGEDLDGLKNDLGGVVQSFEKFTELERRSENDNAYPPLLFGEIAQYESTMQIIGLSYLLVRRDLLPRVVAMFDPLYRGQDALYEDLLGDAIDGRFNVDKWFHDKPYRHLINSFYRDTVEQSIADIVQYLDDWYPAMKDAPWHDGHLNMTETGGSYVGYWAIEAAAAVYLLKLDDSSFRDHIVYPKDLVTFAREQSELATPRGVVEETGPRTVRTGQVCPETGIWKARDHNVPGVRVQQGNVMPEVFAHDERGAFRPLPAVWELERKV